MQFIAIHKQDTASEAGLPPPPELVAGMGKFIGDGTGVFVTGAGLHESAKRSRVRFAGGHRTLEHGPYEGGNELIGGVVMVRVRSHQEAIDWASRLGEALGNAELEVGQVKEPWDIGICPKPEGLETMRYLLIQKGTADSEAGRPPAPAVTAAIERVTAEMVNAGVFLASAWLRPSSHGARLKVSKGRRSVVDGPFAEAKELIGGFSIMNAISKQEALEWSDRFTQVLEAGGVKEDIELDLYEVAKAELTGGSELNVKIS